MFKDLEVEKTAHSILYRRETVLFCLSLYKEAEHFGKTDDRRHQLVIIRMVRAAEIKAFEFSLDTFVKFLREYMATVQGIIFESIALKAILRKAMEANLITQEEQRILITSVDARNITAHAYKEPIAHAICDQLLQFHDTIKAVIERIQM